MSNDLGKAVLWFPADIRTHPLVGFGKSVPAADPSRGSYSHFEAWATIVFTARWEYGRRIRRDLAMELDRGELVASRRWLAETFNWTENKVKWFLSELENVGLICIKQAGPLRANVIKIEDYEIYNPVQTTPEERIFDGNIDEAFRRDVRKQRGVNPMSEVAAQIYKRQQIPFSLRKTVYERDNYTCQTPGCGRQTHLSVDHIIAVTSGGETIFENLVTLCLACNIKKGARNGRSVA